MTAEFRLWRNSRELSEHVAIVDDRDASTVRTIRKWYIHKAPRSRTLYAVGDLNGRRVRMHLLILGVRDDGLETDHVNGNGLDNRRDNLRRSTHAQNMKAAHLLKPFDRLRGLHVSSVRKTLKSTSETVRYYYHKPTRTRLPEYPGHPAFENALATILGK